jgi:hypothetical protein
MKPPQVLPTSIQGKLYEMLTGAHSGDAKLLWLNKLVERAGYVRYEGGSGVLLVNFKQLEKVLGLSARALRGLLSEGLPCARPGVGSNPALFDLAAVLAWHREQKGSGNKSEWLEEWRRQRAIEAKRNNDVAEGRLMPVGRIVDDLREGTLILQQRMDAVGARFGPECAKLLNDAVLETKAAWKARMDALKDPPPNGKAASA